MPYPRLSLQDLTPHARELGERTLDVRFDRMSEKYNGACQYELRVEGVRLGVLCREYSVPGWSLITDDALDEVLERTWEFPRVVAELQWDTLQEARRELTRAFDKMLPWLARGSDEELEWMYTHGCVATLEYIAERIEMEDVA